MKHNSKNLLLILAGLFLWSAQDHLQAQRILNPGEDWTCQFVPEDPWLLVGPSLTAPAGGANGQFTATLNANVPAGTRVRCEAYEGLYFGAATDGQPLSTFIYTSAPPNTITGWFANAWPDHEGTIRFTALNNSVTIKQIDLEVDVRSLFSQRWDYYYLTVIPPAAPPRLTLSYKTNSVRLSWWTNVSAGYVLETANAAAGSTWQTVGTTPTVSNAQKNVTINITNSTRGFFRLRK